VVEPGFRGGAADLRRLGDFQIRTEPCDGFRSPRCAAIGMHGEFAALDVVPPGAGWPVSTSGASFAADLHRGGSPPLTTRIAVTMRHRTLMLFASSLMACTAPREGVEVSSVPLARPTAPSTEQIVEMGQELETFYWERESMDAVRKLQSLDEANAYSATTQALMRQRAETLLAQLPAADQIVAETMHAILRGGFVGWSARSEAYFDRAMALGEQTPTALGGSIVVLAFRVGLELDETRARRAIEMLATHCGVAEALAAEPEIWRSFAWVQFRSPAWIHLGQQPELVRPHHDALARVAARVPLALDFADLMGATNLFQALVEADRGAGEAREPFRRQLLQALEGSRSLAERRGKRYEAIRMQGGTPAQYVDDQIRFLRSARAKGEMVGGQAPALGFLWVSGDESWDSLADLRGRVVVLDFWATWCAPCIASFPQMRAVVEHFEGRPVTVLGVTAVQGYHTAPGGEPIDCSENPGREFELMGKSLADFGITWPVVFIDGSVFHSAYGVEAVPHFVVIDAEGIVRASHTGSPKSADELIQRIEQALSSHD